MGLFGTYSQKQLKKIDKIVKLIEALAPKYAEMTDAELSATTVLLKERLANGETLDDILPDAFAAIREADERVLGKRPFRVQLIGGIILHQGRIAEMKTGEGKTLVATMPAYLNALSGKGVHVVTVNDYLATRDSEEMGRVYEFMGLTTGLVISGLSQEEKQESYNADITYGTNNEFGFDYLRDNMVVYKKDVMQRGHSFAIVDEVDSILIDEARTPLIISGVGTKSTDMYEKADAFARKLRKCVIKEMDAKQSYDDVEGDYIVEEKAHNAILTPSGVKKAEEFFGIENLSDPENSEIAHHINQAIRAHGTMKRDVDYVVNQHGVMIVDAFTGRIMYGRRYSNGLHQAIEAKEGVTVENENRTVATITYQNYFRMYDKLSGMTGTALTEESEFREIYGLDVVEIPTNRPMIRKDHNDILFKTIETKYKHIIEQIKECNKKGQPVLVGTVSIEKSEELSQRLKKEGIPHTVLNAKHHEKEAEIVAQAGKFGAVTISTNMAGRGTDIMLGGNPEYMAKREMHKMEISDELIALAVGTADTDDEEILGARKLFKELYEKYKAEIAPEAEKVREAGGLFILGTERHESRRIDNQLRGRAGRQGDPGESRFYISFEDDLIRLFGAERIIGMTSVLPDDKLIEAKIFSSALENAQRGKEEQNFKRRKHVLAYDDVMNQQRNIIYSQRNSVLNGEDISATITKMIEATIIENVGTCLNGDDRSLWDFIGLREMYKGTLTNANDFEYSDEELKKVKPDDIANMLYERAMKIYKQNEKTLGEDVFREAERSILLRSVDINWMEHIDAMEDLKDTIHLQTYAQRDPINEYRLQGADMFDAMVSDIRSKTVRALTTEVKVESVKRVQVAKPITVGFGGDGSMRVKKVRVPKRSEKTVGRNDPCPCGSGKKYKKCCGSPANQ